MDRKIRYEPAFWFPTKNPPIKNFWGETIWEMLWLIWFIVYQKISIHQQNINANQHNYQMILFCQIKKLVRVISPALASTTVLYSCVVAGGQQLPLPGPTFTWIPRYLVYIIYCYTYINKSTKIIFSWESFIFFRNLSQDM